MAELTTAGLKSLAYRLNALMQDEQTGADSWHFRLALLLGELRPYCEQIGAPPEVALVGNRPPTESEISYGQSLESLAMEALARTDGEG